MFGLAVNVFNYEPNDQQVTVRLEESAHFKVKQSDSSKPQYGALEKVVEVIYCILFVICFIFENQVSVIYYVLIY